MPKITKTAEVTVVKRRPAAALPAVASYTALLERVKRILALGRRKMEEIGLAIYWETGRSIRAHVLQRGERAKYGKQVILKLARDLDESNDLLYRSLQIYDAYPISAPPRKLTLTHYLALARIPDKKKRREFEDKAFKEGWVAEKLEEKVRATIDRSKKAETRHAAPLLEPKKGKLGIYRIIEDSGALHVDLGFTSYLGLENEEAKNVKAGDFVKAASGRFEKVKEAKAEDLYTYEAERIRVIDADTFWMKIWLKRPLWLKEKLRLRGIDAPELDTKGGKAARRFVERLFKRASAITITTTKPDKWDRYLSDVFLVIPGQGEIFLNNLLLQKGHAVRKDRFSLLDWEKE